VHKNTSALGQPLAPVAQPLAPLAQFSPNSLLQTFHLSAVKFSFVLNLFYGWV
jgi:hypothetical protein